MARVATLLFDLDGTLIDSLGLIRASYEHTCRAHLGRAMSEDEWLEGLGRPLAWQFRRYTADAESVAAMIATYRAHNSAHHDQLVRPFAGVREALAELRGRGLGLGVVTSKLRAGARRGLAHCGLADLFEVVIGADDVTRAKPEAEPVERALELLGGRPESCVMVGDSPHDVAAGAAAGARTAAVLWGPFRREHFAAQMPTTFLAETSELARLSEL
jgi:pyrophosphatase PpaX